MTTPATALHVRGVVLPEGELRDLYVVDGHLTYEPVAHAETIAGSSGRAWIVPGLVDAHCHVGLDRHGAVPVGVQEEQSLAERGAGALLLRDAGSAADTRWMDDREDLPRMIRAGRHIARTKRYIPNFAAEVEPADLMAEVERQIARGDGWVKLVGDWIDRGRGDLAPSFPQEAVAAVIARAHELGARVTAHVFGEESLPDLLDAGIDCLEHGTGLQPDMLDAMARNSTALVPTLIQVRNFPVYAGQGEAKFPAYAAHMRALHARTPSVLAAAHEAGVPVYAGTDAGGQLPHGLVAQEVQALHDTVGMTPYDALGAASWAAREWLGRPATLSEGAPADFVVLPADPLADLAVLGAPTLVVLRGTAYDGSVRPTG